MFDYLVTIVIPVYNMEDYLEESLASLRRQTLPFGKMEIIIVDDGSTDTSCEIEEKFKNHSENIKIFNNKHKGVSTARNKGIQNANGKYIMFLDGDDQLAPDTVEQITDFFEQNYHSVDLVTYPLKSYKDSVNGKKLPDHYRYDYLKKTGIYDLKDYPYITQTTMNIVVKNKWHNNILFKKNMSFTEDQAYCFDNLKRIFKIGFCAEGEYQYVRHIKSSSSILMGACYLFEQCMEFWEKLFYDFEDDKKIPKYVQAAYINDLGWKNISNILYPYNYQEKEFKKSLSRIVRLLNLVENDVILGHPGLDEYHKFYFVALKDENCVEVIKEKRNILLCSERLLLKNINKISLVIEKVGFVGDEFIIRGYFSSVLFNFCNDIDFIVSLTLYDENNEDNIIETFIGSQSWHNCHTRTNYMYSFEIKWNDWDKLKSICFYVKHENGELPVEMIFSEDTVFFERNNQKKIISGNMAVTYFDNAFYIQNIEEEKIKQYLKREISYYEEIQQDLAFIRKKAYEKQGKEIWLYYDAKGVKVDNGFYQFCSDFERDDGISRYYVTQNEISFYQLNYKPYADHIIKFGTHQHQILFLNCGKIITAFIENYNIIPYSKIDYGRIADVIRYEVIYLQHGILHAYVPWKYTYLGNVTNKIVISSEYEKKILTEIYHYPENSLICTGMPRFKKKDVDNIENEKYILYAPSWRAYLVFMNKNGEWESIDEKFVKSHFFEGLKSIFMSEELLDFLKKQNIKFIVQLHPIFNLYRKMMEKYENDWIKLSPPDIKYDNCCIFITDFSSYVFDFVRKKKSILYFFTDEEEFYSGMNGYYRLTLSLEDGFGPICRNVNELVKQIQKCEENNFNPQEKYYKKMNQFFYDFSDPCKQIYNELYHK